MPIAALAWWVVGYLPWILAGLRASRNVEPIGGAGVGATRLAIPLVSSSLALLAIGSVMGGLVAGLTGLVRADRRGLATLASFIGVAIAVAVTASQSVSAARDATSGFAADDRVLGGLVFAVVVTSVCSWLFGALAVFGRATTGVALAVLAGALTHWLSSAAFAVLGERAPIGAVSVISTAERWTAAAVLVAALVVIGVRPLVRVLVWPIALLLAWFVGPTLTAAGYLEQLLRPAAGLPGSLPDSLTAAWQVFTQAAAPTNRPLIVWLAAMVAAAAWATLVTVRARSTPSIE